LSVAIGIGDGDPLAAVFGVEAGGIALPGDIGEPHRCAGEEGSEGLIAGLTDELVAVGIGMKAVNGVE